MGGVMLVQELQHVAQLNRPFQHLLLRQEAGHVGEDRFEIAAFDIFHHQIRAGFFAEVIVHFGNGRMAERGQDIGFALEVLHGHCPHLRIERVALHFLDRAQLHHVGKALIARLIDRAHAAQPQNAQDFIAILQNAAGR